MVCTYNGKDKLGPTLEHLARQKGIENINTEVLLIDNASTDGTGDFALEKWKTLTGKFPLRLISEPRAGKANASITGFNACKYSFILVCDDDNWLCEDYVKRAFDIMNGNSSIGVLGGRGVAVFEGTPPIWFARYQHIFAVGDQAAENGDVTDKVDFLWGAGMVFRKEVWAKLVQIQYSFFLNERREGNSNWGGDDVELCEMIRMLGYRLWFDSNLTYQHYLPAGRMSYNYLKSRFYGLGRARVYLHAYVYCRTNNVVPGIHLKYPYWVDKWLYHMGQYLTRLPQYLFESKTEISDDYLKFVALKGEIHELYTLKGQYNKVFEKILSVKKVIEGLKEKR